MLKKCHPQDIIFELKRISELKVALPTNEKLVKDADLRIWLDDLDPYESEKNVSQAAVTANPPDDQADVVSPLFSSRLEEDPFGNNSHQNRLPVLPLRSSHKRSASSDSPQTHSQQDKMPALPSSQRRSAGSDLPAKISSQAIVSSEHERTPTLPSSQRRSAGSDLQTKISSQGSSNETVMQSPDSRETSATFPSSIDTQRSSVQSAQSTQPSPISTESIWRKPVLKTQLPTLTEPMERSAPEPVQRRLTIPPNSMQYGVPPLHMYSNNVPEETKTEGVVSSNPNSPNQARRKIEHSFPSNVSDLQVYDPSAPPSNFVPSNSVPSNFGSISCSSDHENVPLSSIPDPPDLDERPGEVEIMKKVFQKMLLSSSDSFEIQPVWESCSIRIFRKMDSTVRILTFRDSGLDQRFISLKDTEMVPEYGYHKDLPVIFLRKISPDSHYQSPTSQASSIFMGSEDLSAASLYYRFDNSKDLFNFQLAFTGEAVEIDIKSVRTVRFKRNMLDGEHSNYKARLQLWREQTFDTVATGNSGMSSMSKSIAGTIRSRGVTESILKIPSTRLVIFFEEIIVVMFGKSLT